MATQNAWNNTITNAAITLNSTTNDINISSDASATTVNIATGGAAKAVTMGSTNAASSLALQYGTADFTLASATGTVISALDTGEITEPLQPAFLAYNSAKDYNQTGNGTYVTVQFDTEVFDLGGDYNNGTYTFTAPVTGRYFINTSVVCNGVLGASRSTIRFITSNRDFAIGAVNPGAVKYFGDAFGANASALADMDAADTCYVTLYMNGQGADTVTINGNATALNTYFSGYLAV